MRRFLAASVSALALASTHAALAVPGNGPAAPVQVNITPQMLQQAGALTTGTDFGSQPVKVGNTQVNLGNTLSSLQTGLSGAVQTVGGNISGDTIQLPNEPKGRTAAQRAADVYNLADHGLDGVAADDSATMVKALAFATAHPGTHIVLPVGSWPFLSQTGGFLLPSFTTFEGVDQAAAIITWDEVNPNGNNFFSTVQGSNDIVFRNFTIKGMWDPTTDGRSAKSGNAIIPVGVTRIEVSHVTSEDNHFFGITVRASTDVAVDDNKSLYNLTDGINLSECSNIEVERNIIDHVADDAISVHSDIYDTFGVRRAVLIIGNMIHDAQGIRVLGARNFDISLNMMSTVRQQGVNIQTVTAGGTGTTEGVSAAMDGVIANNTIINGYSGTNVDALNGNFQAFWIDSYSARAGTYFAIPGENIVATGKIQDPYPEFLANTDSTSTPTAGSRGILIIGNHVARSFPNSNGTDSRFQHFSDFKEGTLASKEGAKNPALAESDFEGLGVNIDSGPVFNVNIEGNDFSGLYAALSISGSGHFQDIVFRNNNVTDMTSFGVLVNTTATLNLLVDGNLFDLDPYFKSSARGSNGTWTNAGPTALYLQAGSGVSYTRNQIRNAYSDTGGSDPAGVAGLYAADNIDYADVVQVNQYNAANKGVGFPHSTGTKIVQQDSDPTSATWGQMLSNPAEAAYAMPTTGMHIQGDWVRNLQPTLANPVWGWLRNTTGKTNAAGADWTAIPSNPVTPATIGSALSSAGILVSQSVGGVTITSGASYYSSGTNGTSMPITVIFGAAPTGGTTATGHVSLLKVLSISSPTSAGAGYTSGAVENVTDSSGDVLGTFTVTSIGTGGAIAGGTYSNLNQSLAVNGAIPAAPYTIAGGTTAAQISYINAAVLGVKMDNPGSGYTAAPSVTFSSTNAVNAAAATGTASLGGAIEVPGSFQALGASVTAQTAAYTVQPSDCGTTIRDTGTSAHVYSVPAGLQLGCHVDVVQAGSGGTITFAAGSGETLEEAGSGTLTHATTGQFAKAQLSIDSASTFLLGGQVQ